MLHILLLILKIIGIVLGTLLAVLLIGLCIALFVPVRYQIEASRTEAEGAPPIEASAKITWLLHLVNIRIQYPADVYLRARIFLFTVFRLPQKPKKTDDKKKRRKKKQPAEGGENDSAVENGENDSAVEGGESDSAVENEEKDFSIEGRENVSSVKRGENASSAESEANVIPAESKEPAGNAEAISDGKAAVQEEAPSMEPVSEPGKQKKTCLEKLKEKIMQIRRIFQKIWYTLTGICDKIKTIWENIEYYIGILQSDTFKRAFSLCKDELSSVFSYIRPRKFQADVTIGMDDPAATGKILSYYGMLYPFIGSSVNVVSDFERKRLEGTVFIKGKIRLFTFVKAALRIYFNKDIRKLLKLFKKEDL